MSRPSAQQGLGMAVDVSGGTNLFEHYKPVLVQAGQLSQMSMSMHPRPFMECNALVQLMGCVA